VYHIHPIFQELLNPPHVLKRAHVPKLLMVSFSRIFKCPRRSCSTRHLPHLFKLRHFYDVRACDLHETRDERPALSATKRHRMKRACMQTNDIQILSHKKAAEARCITWRLSERQILHSLSHTTHKQYLKRRHFVSETKEKSLASYSLERKYIKTETALCWRTLWLLSCNI
jgi:hypothetical protein